MAHEKQESGTMHRAISDALGIHWRLFLFQGLVTLALGIFAVALPVAATIAVDIFIGWLFLVCGIVGLFAIFSTRNIPAFTWNLVTAALSTAIGILLIWHPVAGAQSLTILLTVLFLVEGVFQIATSIAYRDVVRESWGWMLTSGIADLVLVVIIILGWPMTANWALGLLVGVNLITSGFAVVMVAIAGRRITRLVDKSVEETPH
ncbi:MAG: HdeD family acid-resistance protein [Rhizomicrobium sp.]